MGTVKGPGGMGLGRSETQRDVHRPAGSPQKREAKSQLAQLKSVHDHGTKKDVKRGMEFKDGRAEKEMWGEWNEPFSDWTLEERVQMLLDSDADLWKYDLHSSVENGVVEVTGVVDVEEEKERLEKLVRGIEGIKGYEINVAVNADEANVLPPEEEKRIREGEEGEEGEERLIASMENERIFHNQVRNDDEDFG